MKYKAKKINKHAKAKLIASLPVISEESIPLEEIDSTISAQITDGEFQAEIQNIGESSAITVTQGLVYGFSPADLTPQFLENALTATVYAIDGSETADEVVTDPNNLEQQNDIQASVSVDASGGFQGSNPNEDLLSETEIIEILEKIEFTDYAVIKSAQELADKGILGNEFLVEKQIETGNAIAEEISDLKPHKSSEHPLLNKDINDFVGQNNRINKDIDIFSVYLTIVNRDYIDNNQTVSNFENNEGIYEGLLIIRDALVGQTRNPLLPINGHVETSLAVAKEIVYLAQQQYDKTVEDVKQNPSKLPEVDAEIIIIAQTISTDAYNILTYVKTVEAAKKSVTTFVNKLNDWFTGKPCNTKAFNDFRNLFANNIDVTIYVKPFNGQPSPVPPIQGLLWSVIGNVNRAVLMDLFRALLTAQTNKYIRPGPFDTSLPYNTITYKAIPDTIGGKFTFDITLTTDCKNKINGIVLGQSPFIS